ncbi:orotidine-5'-phosphate decarboxylase [Halorussus sp. MSC15.2]|uniref:orotidine-5'-phosphate decarboxylase n=1 Tax=Halorussus sp. MSC15.2 TaxID=2283638 RepID=UPI0013D1A5F4|nr:orotidine-5'-phosphate decarboxylase [Halorussus sp. MSC15.2]NEU55845.1 orotidine-5'-phosphate decarboxylase [Halorussus sp. MSC15.2]
MTFFDRLRERIRTTGGVLAVGLNPDPARLPDDCREYDYPRRAFNRRIVDATYEGVAAYSVAPAYYADPEGWTALAETVAYARGRGVPVVLDAKYAEIPSPDADLLDSVDAVTVSPYLGRDALAPVLDRDLGVFVTCRTPNAGAADLQDREVAEGEMTDHNGEDEQTDDEDEKPTLAGRAAELGASWAADAAADVGLLVGGDGETVETLRERAPDRPFFAVGGARNDPEVAAHVGPASGANEGLGLVETSREVLYAGETAGRGRRRGQDDYAAAARQAAGRLAGQLNRHR